MTILKTFASVNAYYKKQITDLREPLDWGPPADAVPDAASERARVRDRCITAYADVYGQLTDADADMLRRLWALEDEPVLTLVASKVTGDPADPAFDADAAREAKVTAWLALYEEDPLDVPGAEGPPVSASSVGTVPGPAIMPSPPEAAGPGAQEQP